MMYTTPTETLTARKPHRCTSCGEVIIIGEKYLRWRCYDSGDAGTGKMHPECYEIHEAEGSPWEYTPYSYERPQAI